MDHEAAKQVAETFVHGMETNDFGTLFADDVFCDINVPEWRFQMQGPAAISDWMRSEQPDGCRVKDWSCEPTASGLIVELVQVMGEEISRNLHRLAVSDGKVSEWTMYCTGVWSVQTQAKQAAEAPMIRP